MPSLNPFQYVHVYQSSSDAPIFYLTSRATPSSEILSITPIARFASIIFHPLQSLCLHATGPYAADIE